MGDALRAYPKTCYRADVDGKADGAAGFLRRFTDEQAWRIEGLADSSELRKFAVWAFSTQPLLPRDTFAPEDCDAWFEQAQRKDNPREKTASLVLAWYRRCPWSDSELAEKLSKTGRHDSFRPTAREMLPTLGEPGRRVLERWDAEEKER